MHISPEMWRMYQCRWAPLWTLCNKVSIRREWFIKYSKWMHGRSIKPRACTTLFAVPKHGELFDETADWHYTKVLHHGCARVAHCVTPRWRNFFHYCRSLRQHDVWFTCYEHRGALTAHRQHTVYKNKRLQCKDEVHTVVRHWTSREASLRHSSGWGDWSVSPSVAWFAHPCTAKRIPLP